MPCHSSPCACWAAFESNWTAKRFTVSSRTKCAASWPTWSWRRAGHTGAKRWRACSGPIDLTAWRAANLRQALSSLRRALGDTLPAEHASAGDPRPPPFLLVTPTDVQFNTGSDFALDVAELEAFAGKSGATRPQLLPAALCADLLAGFSVPDSEAFQAWVLDSQERYHGLALSILDDQYTRFEKLGEYDLAVEAARLELRMEPWLEEAHRRCMRALALAGRRGEALHQYEACCRALELEIGVKPAGSTRALYADIRDGRLVATSQTPAGLSPPPEQGRERPGAPAVRLVAREDELGQLGRHLHASLGGETQAAFVSGDRGSGKTALPGGLRRSSPGGASRPAGCRRALHPGRGPGPFAALRKLAEMLFGDPANEAAWWSIDRDQVDRLQQATPLLLSSLAEHGLGLVDTLVPAASIAHRAGVCPARTAAGRPSWWVALQAALQARLENRLQPPAPLSQGVLFDQLLCTLAAVAQRQPLLLLLDDLQWVDDATAAFLHRIGDRRCGSRGGGFGRVFVLGAFRSGTVALGRRDPQSGEVLRHPLAIAINELRRREGEITVDLDRADGRAFVEAYVDAEPNRLGARFRDALYAQTGGHALFTVETLRNLQERGELFRDEAGRWTNHESLDWGALPARVEAAIAERIARLPEACRRILSAASVQGDSFCGEVVAELTGASISEVLTCLSGSLARQHALVRAEGVVRPGGLQGLGGGQRSVYRFTHHLFQKHLYGQLDPVERARWHGAVADALDRQAAGDAAERERLAAQLAWHYESAGLPLQAARALYDAGRRPCACPPFARPSAITIMAWRCWRKPARRRRRSARAQSGPRSCGCWRSRWLGPERNLEGLAGAGMQGALAGLPKRGQERQGVVRRGGRS